MRGIAGIIRFDGRAVLTEEIERMAERTAAGSAAKRTATARANVGLAHVLSPTTCEDHFEAQPLRGGSNGLQLVTDIVLENRPELLAELGRAENEHARMPDSTLVLAAWERWGAEAPLHLESSAFAVAVWDERAAELTCCTGRQAGELFYWHGDGTFAFANTLRGLFALPEVPRELDELGLAEHLIRLPHSAGRTIYRHVRRLAVAHRLRVSARGLSVSEYWSVPAPSILQLPKADDYVEAFRLELTAAIRRKSRVAHHLGCMVSGGLDSSTIAAFASRDQLAQGKRLRAFHIRTDGENRYRWAGRELDESGYAKAVAEYAPQIDFHFVPSDPAIIPVAEWEQYFALHHVPPVSLPAPLNRHLAQCLDVHEIDCLLFGYTGNLIVSMQSSSWNYLHHLFREQRWWTFAREMWGYHRVYQWPLRGLWREARRQPAVAWPRESLARLQPAFRRRSGIDERVRQHVSELEDARDLRERIHRHFVHAMRQPPGTSFAPAPSGRAPRFRAPLADLRLNLFCLRLPYEQQIRHGWDRRLVRRVTAGLLPESVRWRTTRGLPQPEFQIKFETLLRELGGVRPALAAIKVAGEYLKTPQLSADATAESSNRPWRADLDFAAAITLDRFLTWLR